MKEFLFSPQVDKEVQKNPTLYPQYQTLKKAVEEGKGEDFLDENPEFLKRLLAYCAEKNINLAEDTEGEINQKLALLVEFFEMNQWDIGGACSIMTFLISQWWENHSFKSRLSYLKKMSELLKIDVELLQAKDSH